GRGAGCEIGHTESVAQLTPSTDTDGYNGSDDFPLSSETPPARVTLYRPRGQSDRGAFLLRRRDAVLAFERGQQDQEPLLVLTALLPLRLSRPVDTALQAK